MMPKDRLHKDTALFRRFNRFHTKQIGLLSQGLLKTRFPLIQARVLYELAQQKQTTASALVDKLNFERVSESPHKSFGQELIAEFWELTLGG